MVLRKSTIHISADLLAGARRCRDATEQLDRSIAGRPNRPGIRQTRRLNVSVCFDLPSRTREPCVRAIVGTATCDTDRALGAVCASSEIGHPMSGCAGSVSNDPRSASDKCDRTGVPDGRSLAARESDRVRLMRGAYRFSCRVWSPSMEQRSAPCRNSGQSVPRECRLEGVCCRWGRAVLCDLFVDKLRGWVVRVTAENDHRRRRGRWRRWSSAW
jgi:hypothetical protein